MEFLDEEARPRFLFQSRPPPPPSSSYSNEPQTTQRRLHTPTVFVSLSLSSLVFALSLLHFSASEPLNSLLLWLSLSLLVGPFAPPSLTAGDVRVGVGPVVHPPPPQVQDPDSANSTKKPSNRRSIANRSEDLGQGCSIPAAAGEVRRAETGQDLVKPNGNVEEAAEGEWTEADLELLKKQAVKYPVGMPGRWEAVAEAFSGRRRVESVVKMAKSMAEKRIGNADSFAKFLKDRKAVDRRIDEAGEPKGEEGSACWSTGEDLALLNALKAFPKDSAMRWEKVAAAVPGKSKAACVKRVAELKRDFRSSKPSSEA